MVDYAYKVILTADDEDCLAKRAVAFHDDRFLDFWDIAEEAPRHLTSQTCPRCKKNHEPDSYTATQVQRGEPSVFGFHTYRDVFPSYGTQSEPELFV